MYHHSPTPMSLYLAFALTALVLLAVALIGCQQEQRLAPITLGTPAMLFDDPAMAPIASTAIPRAAWPSVPGPLESIEESYMLQYYRDYQGNAFNERNSPMRYTRSIRRSTQLR